MPDWLPLVLILTAIVAAVALVLAVSINAKNKQEEPPDDFFDTLPLHYGEDTRSVQLEEPEQAIDVELPPVVNPAIQAAQDNLNYTLWHQLLWRIPNTQWIETRHQSLVEVQWLCLGPDHYYFIAHAELVGNEWKWTFTKA